MLHRLFAAALALSTVDVPLAAQDHAPSPPVFRSGVNLVRLDLTVVDADGRPVTDLRAGELRIIDGASARPVILFQRVGGAGADYVEASRRSVAGDISTNTGAPQGQLYVLVFDQDHISAGAEHPVRAAADAFLRDRVRRQDRVAVFGLPGPGPAQPFTANVAAARRQLDAVRGGLERRSVAAVAEMSVHEAYEIMRGNERVLSRFTTADPTGTRTTNQVLLELARTAGDDAGVIRRLVRENAQTIVAAADAGARQFLAAFADLLRSFRGTDGRKTVILFSEGFHADNVGRELELVAAAAAETYSVIYGFDLNRPGDLAAAERSSDDASAEMGSRIEPMGSLAAETSGELVRDAAGRLDRALTALQPDEGGYYLVGFERAAAQGGDGAYRRVTIATTRPGARVISRTGYSTEAAPADRRKAIDTALAAPFTQQGLRLEYTTYVGQAGAPGLQRVAVSLRADLPIQRADPAARADVVFVVRDSRTGQVAASGSDAIALPASAEAGRSTGEATWRVAFELPAGEYLMRCVVREPGGILGSADRRFSVRALGGADLAATDLIVHAPEESLPVRARLYTEDALTGMLRVFGPSADALAGATARLELTPIVASEEQRTGRIIDGVIGDPIAGDRGTSRDVTFHLPLERLPAGEYTARATVRRSGAIVADVRRTVEVIVGAPPARSPGVVRARDVLDGEIAQVVIRETIDSSRNTYARAAAAAERRQWQDVLNALANAPADDVNVQRLRGIALLATEQYAASASALTSAFRLQSTDASLAFVLGWASSGADNRPAAIAAFRNAAFLDPSMVAAHIALGETYLSGGHVDLARQAVSAGLRAIPDSVELKRLAARIGK